MLRNLLIKQYEMPIAVKNVVMMTLTPKPCLYRHSEPPSSVCVCLCDHQLATVVLPSLVCAKLAPLQGLSLVGSALA